MERDQLIEQLTDRLQQSINDREDMQKQSEQLTHEVVMLKKQLADTLELIKKPPQFRDTVSSFFSYLDFNIVRFILIEIFIFKNTTVKPTSFTSVN